MPAELRLETLCGAGVLLGALALVLACAPHGEPARRLEVVRIALHGDPSSLDPHLQSEVIAQAVLGNIYETLVAFGPDMRIEPQLAETWDNPSDLIWRFRLRRGVTFHDGRPLTLGDVIASIDRVKHHARSRQAGSLVAVKSVRQVDERTLELLTDRPYPILLNRLAFVAIVPADAPEEILEPVGTGPYRFVGRQPGVVELAAAQDHWRVVGQPKRAEYHFVGETRERIEGLQQGRFDLVDDVPAQLMSEIDADPALRTEHLSSLSVSYLQLDPTAPPFDDPRVRQALNLAIDRQELVRELYAGFAVPAGQMVSRNVFGYAPELRPPRRDLETARQLLREAGYPDGLDLKLEVREGRPDAPILQRQLAEAGVRLEVFERPWGEMYSRLTERRVPFYLGGWVCTSGDAGDVLDRKLHSRRDGLGYGDANYSGFSSPALDELIQESNTQLDLEARQRLLQQALTLAAKELAYLPLYSPEDTFGVRSDFDWQPRQDGRIYAFEIRGREAAK